MKYLITLCLLAAIATVNAATELRSVRFEPATGAISLTVSEDGFSRAANINSTALSADQQTAIGSVLTWLGSQLPAGFATVQQIILEPGPEIPATYGEQLNTDDPPVMVTVPLTWRRTLNAAVTGSGPAGERTIVVTGGTAPEEMSAGLLAIWDALEAAQ